MKHLFIINPAAGKGKTLKLIPEIEKIFKNRKDEYVIEITNGIGHASEIAKKYSQSGEYRIYSVGGDGTLNEVINGMVNSDSSLAVIPSGTGNDFIRNIYDYWEHDKIENILLKTVNGKENYIDLGKVNNRYFINIASLGFDAEVVYNSIKLKKLPILGGKLAYILSIIITVFKYSKVDITIQIDKKQFNKKTLLVAIANGRCYGGGINVTPQAKINDGIFDICVIDKVSKFKILTLFPKVIQGNHATIKEVCFFTGETIKIESNKEIPLNIDGEISTVKEAEFKIIKKGIKVVYPK